MSYNEKRHWQSSRVIEHNVVVIMRQSSQNSLIRQLLYKSPEFVEEQTGEQVRRGKTLGWGWGYRR